MNNPKAESSHDHSHLDGVGLAGGTAETSRSMTRDLVTFSLPNLLYPVLSFPFPPSLVTKVVTQRDPP